MARWCSPTASGGQFFLPGSWQFYFDQLPGEKYLRYAPYAAHAATKSTGADESIADECRLRLTPAS